MDSEPRAAESRRFWNELYWFAAIGVAAATLALLVVPGRLAAVIEMRRRERGLDRELRAIEARERVYSKAIEAVENDPYYREGVFRALLQARRPGEEPVGSN
jgi:hypothetical protein